jgi:hypothetical protein
MVFRLMMPRWLYSTLIPESDRHGRNIYDPKANVPFYNLKNGMRFADGLEVSIDGVYFDDLRLGETTQRDQMVFRASSIVIPNGNIAQSVLMEGILALKPRHDATCKCPRFY